MDGFIFRNIQYADFQQTRLIIYKTNLLKLTANRTDRLKDYTPESKFGRGRLPKPLLPLAKLSPL